VSRRASSWAPAEPNKQPDTRRTEPPSDTGEPPGTRRNDPPSDTSEPSGTKLGKLWNDSLGERAAKRYGRAVGQAAGQVVE
jgi:hypothetical protein